MNTLPIETKLMYFMLSMSFFIFMYRVYYGRYYKEIGYCMNQHNPVGEFYRYLFTIYCLFAFLFDKYDISNPHLTFPGITIVFAYNIIDSTYYKHGKTNITWLIHHIIVLLSMAFGLYCDVHYIRWRIFWWFEFGGIFFCLQLESPQIRELPLLRAGIIVFYVCSRLIISLRLYQFTRYVLLAKENNFSLIENLGHSTSIFCGVLAVILNLYFAEKSRQSIMRRLKRNKSGNRRRRLSWSKVRCLFVPKSDIALPKKIACLKNN